MRNDKTLFGFIIAAVYSMYHLLSRGLTSCVLLGIIRHTF